jgi:hypothetical protein
MKKHTSNEKKGRLKKYLLPAVIIAITFLVIALVLTAYRPGRYTPVKIEDQNLVSPYLTHQLMPEIYNNTQLGEPFEVVITQQGLNDIVARLPQPIRLNTITLVDPQVLLIPEQIILMATVKARPIDFFITIELKPAINAEGLLNLHVNNVKLGMVNITAVTRMIGDKVYSNWVSATDAEPNDLAPMICRSLLNDEPFEPLFKTGGRQLRLSEIDIDTNGIRVKLTPIPNQRKMRPSLN